MSHRPTAGKVSSRKGSLDGRGGTLGHDGSKAAVPQRGGSSSQTLVTSELKSRSHGKGPASPLNDCSGLEAKRMKVLARHGSGHLHDRDNHIQVGNDVSANQKDVQGLQAVCGLQEHSSSAKKEVPTTRVLSLPTRLGSKASLRKRPIHRGALERTVSNATVTSHVSYFKAFDSSEVTSKLWTGDDAEDQLSDQVIKEGFASKPKISNELGSAKPTLLPHVKTNEGPHTLSQFFLFAIAERRRSQAVTNLSTFKPPPRVTLTDARKTAWFADLANNAIPLRRLSRTIPHGVRGRFLLEQCCTHGVPVSRALWLAKCVGANELRAFKRKGVSSQVTSENELRWVQEWTLQVFDFLWDSQSDGISNLSHAMHLVTCLSAEVMIHRGQFLDCMFNKLEACFLDDALTCLGLLRSWHADIVMDFGSSRRLILALAKRLLASESSEKEAFASGQMQLLLQKTFALVVQPFLPFLTLTVPPAEEAHIGSNDRLKLVPDWPRFDSIERQLRLLLHRSYVHSDAYNPLLSALDSRSVAEQLRCLSELTSKNNEQDIVRVIMQWASTTYRSHPGAAFVATSLLERLLAPLPAGSEIVLQNVLMLAKDINTSPARIAKLTTMLSSVRLLDISAYMRSLIASGALYGGEGHECQLAILGRIPSDILSSQAIDMRIYMLQSLEAASKSSMLTPPSYFDIESALPTMWALFHDPAPSEQHKEDDITTIDPQGICSHIKISLFRLSADRQKLRLKSPDEAKAFCLLLSELDDVSQFFDFLAPIIRAGTSAMLGIFADFIMAYESALTLAGHFEALRDLVVSRYRALRLSAPPNWELLKQLSSFNHNQAWQQQYLANELRVCEQSQGITANTPASDILTLDGTTPRCSDETPPLGRKYAGSCILSYTQVEALIDAPDQLASILTLQSAVEFLKNNQKTGVNRSLLLVRLLCSILRNMDGISVDFLEDLYSLCASNYIRDMLIDCITRHGDTVIPLLISFGDTPSSRETLSCIAQLTCNLLDPLQHNEALRAFVSTDSDPASKDGANLHLQHLIRHQMETSDDLSASINRVGLGVMARIYLQNAPCDIDVMSDMVRSEVDRAIAKNTSHWAESLSLLPPPFDVIPTIRDNAVKSLLSAVGQSSSASTPKYDRTDTYALLAVVKEATLWTPAPNQAYGIVSEIGGALQVCNVRSLQSATEPLEAVLSLALLYHSSLDSDETLKPFVASLCHVIANTAHGGAHDTTELLYATAGHFASKTSQSGLDSVASSLPAEVRTNKDVRFLLGICNDLYATIYLRCSSSAWQHDPSLTSTLGAFNLSSNDPAGAPHAYQPFEVRRWDMLPDASTKEGENDTPLGLRLFDASKIG